MLGKTNGANRGLVEQTILDLNNEVLNKPIDEMTKKFTRYYIKGLVDDYKKKTGEEYDGFIPESVKELF